MKKLLTVAALTALTATSAFATTSHQGWRGQEGWRSQAIQSYASSDDIVSSSRDSATSPYGVVMSPSRDSATSPYFGLGYGPSQITGSSIVQ